MGDEKDQQSKRSKSQDHLSETPLEEYGLVKGPNRTTNLSQNEVVQKLEVMSRIGLLSDDHTQHYVTIQKIKERYKTEIEMNTQNRTKADIHYAQGVRTGLPHTNHEIIQDIRDRKDQDHRNHILSEAKVEYQKSVSLTQTFTKVQTSKTQAQLTSKPTKNHGAGRKK